MKAYEILMKGVGKPILSSSFDPVPPTEQEIISGLKEDNHKASKKRVSLDISFCSSVLKKSFRMGRMAAFENAGGNLTNLAKFYKKKKKKKKK